METNSERRRAKLKALCEMYGLLTVAEKSGLNPATLDQILKGVLLPPKKNGTRSPRALGNPAAAAIEAAFWLGRGWFDAPDSTVPEKSQLGDRISRPQIIKDRVAGYSNATPSVRLSERALDIANTFDRLTKPEDQQDLYIECIKLLRARLHSPESADLNQANGGGA